MYFIQALFNHFNRSLTNDIDAPGSPIQTFYLIRQNDPVKHQHSSKAIPFLLFQNQFHYGDYPNYIGLTSLLMSVFSFWEL